MKKHLKKKIMSNIYENKYSNYSYEIKKERIKNNKRNTKKKGNVLDKLLDVPKEISTGLPKITIIGFNEILIENYKGVLEYEEFYVRVNTYIGVVNIHGMNFNIQNISEEDMLISGKIDSIDIENDLEER